VLPPGSGLTVTGGASNGFLPVWYNGTEGWIVAQYVDDGAAAGDDPPDLTAPAAPEVAPATGGGLIWPVTGGTWEVMQGYNGSSHQNNSGTWQYYYSLDLVREDGGTAGQPVVSPANGTVRWLDPSTGGISIDIGDGHAVALFHVAGRRQHRGRGRRQPGAIPGHHLRRRRPRLRRHAARPLRALGNGRRRQLEPHGRSFRRPLRDQRHGFPDTGGGNQHRGTTFTP
jgi:hypothetical protein